MVLVLAKRKYVTLKKIEAYSKQLNDSSEKKNLMLHHYQRLALWLKLSSSLSQILIDFLLGIIFLVLLYNYSKFVVRNVKVIMFWTEVDILKSQVNWTMNFLADFKPNPQLDRFLGGLLLELLNFWNFITTYATQYEESSAKYLIAPFGIMGISFQFALVHDLLAIITSHIHSIYSLFAFMHKICFEMVWTLVQMFRGKKYNVLQKKVDNADYSIQELVFGMLLLTILLFLMPTLTVYYLSMIYLMCFIVTIQVSLVLLCKI